MNTFLHTLQQNIAQTIRTLPPFQNNIQVLTRESNNWKSALIESIQTAHGLSIIVLPPSPHHIQPGTPGFACERILLRIEILESSLVSSIPISLENTCFKNGIYAQQFKSSVEEASGEAEERTHVRDEGFNPEAQQRGNLKCDAYIPKELSVLSVAETLSHALNRREIKINDWSGCLELNNPFPWKEIHDPLRPNHRILELQFVISGLLPNHFD